jgi:hypothetical protein
VRAAIFRNGEIVVDTLPEPKPAAGMRRRDMIRHVL